MREIKDRRKPHVSRTLNEGPFLLLQPIIGLYLSSTVCGPDRDHSFGSLFAPLYIIPPVASPVLMSFAPHDGLENKQNTAALKTTA